MKSQMGQVTSVAHWLTLTLIASAKKYIHKYLVINTMEQFHFGSSSSTEYSVRTSLIWMTSEIQNQTGGMCWVYGKQY